MKRKISNSGSGLSQSALSRDQLKSVAGGIQEADPGGGSCSPSCSSGKKISCDAPCGATDDVGCYTFSNGTLYVKTC